MAERTLVERLRAAANDLELLPGGHRDLYLTELLAEAADTIEPLVVDLPDLSTYEPQET